MAELPDQIYAAIERLSAEGNDFAELGRFKQALVCYEEAWAQLPEPKTSWNAGLWLLASMGDMQFKLGRFPDARANLMDAVKYFDEARGNPFVQLRLGQTMLELGEEAEAANWLAGAYLSEGLSLFQDDDPKYVSFIKGKLQPPPGGWPEGW